MLAIPLQDHGAAVEAFVEPGLGGQNAMQHLHGILLLDDGELESVAELLDELQLAYTRLRSSEIGEHVAPPRDLLIATPRHAKAVRRGSPSGARPGRPVRIIAAPEDSTAMRRMLRRMGFHLLVRLPSHHSVWRLLIRRSIYQGDERRIDARVAVGAPIAVDGGSRAHEVVLMDISNRGCRLHSQSAFELGSSLSLVLPSTTTGGEPLELEGRLVRVTGRTAADGSETHTAAMIFDDDLDDRQRVQLGGVINKWSMGPSSIASHHPGGPALPPCRSAAIPGLTLDDETDPAIHVGQPVSLHIDPEPCAGAEVLDRRLHPRGAYTGPVVAMEGRRSRVLMGRDLSAGGMRVERLPDLEVGACFRIALYGPSQGEPLVLAARVVRDDGEAGFGIAFEDVPDATAKALEKVVACLPEVESLTDGEANGLGAVLSEILDDDRTLG